MTHAIRSPVLQKDAPPAYADQPDLSCFDPALVLGSHMRCPRDCEAYVSGVRFGRTQHVRNSNGPEKLAEYSTQSYLLVAVRPRTGIVGNGRIKFDIIDDDPKTRFTKSLSIGFDNNHCTVTFGGLGCWKSKYVSVGRRRKGAISITVRLEHMARDGAYYWIWIPLEKRFELPQGQPVPSTFPFHLEGSMLPLFGPLGRLVRMINPGKHLITSESITSSERSSNVTFAKSYPQKCF